MMRMLRMYVVWADRGGRSRAATLRRKYKEYINRAKQLGYKGVVHRFFADATFRAGMIEQGWNENSIRTIEEDFTPERAGLRTTRTKEEREQFANYYYRNVQYTEPGTEFGQAQLWNPTLRSESNAWRKIKRQWAQGKGGGSEASSSAGSGGRPPSEPQRASPSEDAWEDQGNWSRSWRSDPWRSPNSWKGWSDHHWKSNDKWWYEL